MLGLQIRAQRTDERSVSAQKKLKLSVEVPGIMATADRRARAFAIDLGHHIACRVLVIIAWQCIAAMQIGIGERYNHSR